ncbi:MAG: hypothetical protein V8R83_12625 [Candidatus Gastranaerophilaceae bacterium]
MTENSGAPLQENSIPFYIISLKFKLKRKLEQIGKREGLTFPTKSFKYGLSGYLEEISLYVSKKETYSFNANGQLKFHWINNKCYDLNGNLIKTSSYYK